MNKVKLGFGAFLFVAGLLWLGIVLDASVAIPLGLAFVGVELMRNSA